MDHALTRVQQVLPVAVLAVLFVHLQLTRGAALDLGAGFYTHTFSVYSHNTLTGASPTAKIINGIESGYGRLFVADDKLTANSSSTSQSLGWLKGVGADTDVTNAQNHISLYLTFFLQYNGLNGTIIAVGTNETPNQSVLGDLAIVGGTGDFILSKGVVSLVANDFDSSDPTVLAFTKLWKFVLYYDPWSPVLPKIKAAVA